MHETAAGTTTLSAGDAAWLAALPCALATLLLVLVLGPFVGDALPDGAATFWEVKQQLLHPEPAEQGRVVVALAGPLLLAAATALLAGRAVPLDSRTVAQLLSVAQAVLVVFALVCVAAQWSIEYGLEYEITEPVRQRYFDATTLLLSVLGAAAVVAGVRSARVRELATSWTRDTPVRAVVWTLVAAAFTALWLLHAFNTEATVANSHFAAAYHVQFTLDETYAVLNGRTPLVDFTAQYGFLWPYPVAAIMAVLGTSIGVFAALMCLISGLALLGMYSALRRATRSALTALVLFAPFLATSFFLLRGPLESRYTFATIFADYPLRFAGPWLLAWLAARHLDGARPHASWPLFLAGGLVAMNNTDHGIPALAALLAALLWAGGRPTRASLLALARGTAIGLLGAFALVSAITLVRAGALPDLSLAFRFARLFASAGFAMMPMPTLGLHTLLYVTFAAALVVATVRALGDAGAAQDPGRERVLTGLLAFSAIFGLGTGSYYAGRSHPEVLVASFAIWSFAIALLTIVVVRRLAARESRWPEPAAALCLVAFFATACSLAQTPAPWSQLDRLQQTTEQRFREPVGQTFVAEHVEPGERVAILMLLGHRIGENVGVEDVAPYTGSQSMPAVEQLDETVDMLREEGGRKLFLSRGDTPPDVLTALREAGFALEADDGDLLELWVDRR